MPHYPYILEGRHGRVSVTRVAVKHRPGMTRYRIRCRQGSHNFVECTYREDKALARAAELHEQIKAGDAALPQLTKDKIAYLLACEQLLEGSGVSLMEVVTQWRTQGIGTIICLETAVTEFERAQRKRGLTERHLKTVASHLRKFKKHAGGAKEIRMFDVAALNQFLDSIPGLVYRANHRRTLGTFFEWCRVHKYVRENPVPLTSMPMIRHKTPQIVTPADLETFLRCAEEHYPEIVLFLAVGAFAGIRAAEIQRLEARHVSLEKGVIHLPCEVTKTNIARTARIPANLREWLEERMPADGLLVRHRNPNVVIQRMCARLKMAWVQNGLRHSFVTYMTQLSNNAEVADQCGHSLYTSASTYRGLSDKETAKEWFAILPLTPEAVAAT